MKKKRQKSTTQIMSPNFEDERVGCVAVSTAGHDEGLLLVIVAGLDDKHVLVADGRNRKFIAPKKKKMQHLSMLTRLSDEDAEQLKKGMANDSFLRKRLSALDPQRLT